MQQARGQFLISLFLALAAAYIAAPDAWVPDKYKLPFLREYDLKLGIDLRGGAELTYRILFPKGYPNENKDGIARQAVAAIERRINNSGLKEPRINIIGNDQISLQLPGVNRDELDDFKNLLKTVGKLELKCVATKEIHEAYNRDGKVPSGYEAYPKPRERGGDLDYIKEKILVEAAPVIGGADLVSTEARPGSWIGTEQGWSVSFTLSNDGALRFDEAAVKLFKRDPKGMIAIILDGKIQSYPTVQTDNFDGQGQITGNFDKESAQHLALVLRSGSLPMEIGRYDDGKASPGEPEAENFVGPSLGQDSIRRGLFAVALSGAAVALFMLFYYRAGGLLAVLSLIINLVFLMCLMTLFGATLTLPGIAGIVLTVGMAVDNNILILERIREEMAKGKTALQAFEAGHDRAFSAIFDGNITTLLAAIVLYIFGTGPVRGFAVSLSIGILTTMFSVLYTGKSITQLLVMSGAITQFRMRRLFTTLNLQYTKMMRPCLILSGLAVVGSIVLFVTAGERKYGIDFRGGTVIHFGLKSELPIDEVRSRIQAIRESEGGTPRYSDAEILTMSSNTQDLGLTGSRSKRFQFRTASQDQERVRTDLQTAFAGLLSHDPFALLPATDLPSNPLFFPKGPAGGGLFVYLEGDLADLAAQEKIVLTALKDLKGHILTTDPDRESLPMAKLERYNPDPAIPGITRARLLLLDADAKGNDKLIPAIRHEIQTLGDEGKIPLCTSPFTYIEHINPAIAQDLTESTILALILSWVLIIAYIAVRFTSWKFGAAAVIALIHDSIISVGAICLCVLVVPQSWGLSFEMNVTTVAAILTIIGYSVNDTIVIFDRMRENLGLMKKETFAELINASINQTMSRTLLTSFTVWLTVAILYAVTMQSGNGIPTFAFPMLAGLLAGTYSTVFIAAPVLLAWYKGLRPVVTK